MYNLWCIAPHCGTLKEFKIGVRIGNPIKGKLLLPLQPSIVWGEKI